MATVGEESLTKLQRSTMAMDCELDRTMKWGTI